MYNRHKFKYYRYACIDVNIGTPLHIYKYPVPGYAPTYEETHVKAQRLSRWLRKLLETSVVFMGI